MILDTAFWKLIHDDIRTRVMETVWDHCSYPLPGDLVEHVMNKVGWATLPADLILAEAEDVGK